jgi:hypothetical protein
VLVLRIHDTTRLIRAIRHTAADIPLCTETITAKDLIVMTMAMAMVRLRVIFHIIIVMVITMPRLTGIMTIQDIGNNTGADIAMTGTIITMTLSAETIINRLPINTSLTL